MFFVMNLHGFCMSLGKNYGFELSLLRRICRWSEPKISVQADMYLHKKMDHCPKLEFIVIFLWWTIIEMNIYNVNHVSDEESTDKKLTVKRPERDKED